MTVRTGACRRSRSEVADGLCLQTYRPLGGSRLDHGLDLLVSLFVDHRSFPLFAMLFGYGMWQIVRSAPGAAPIEQQRFVTGMP